ncbi:MAG: 23S rRNA pseudouridine(955/2504/2580) synthase RluC [Proteobacteria bacterium]|nr:23S rRNA pseudouridine(955/2504/2580) synthase RluC [Pseudomonadota bacterium]
MVKTVSIDAEQVGQRIDNFLFKSLKGVPKSRIYRAIRGGEVRVNRKRTKPDYRLQLNDQIRIPPLAEEKIKVVKPRGEVIQAIRDKIVYEDDELIVIDKPAGLPVHGGTGIGGGVIELLRLVRPELRFLELIHRIDRETSGCLLIAKKRKTLLFWHQQLKNRKIYKQYITLVKGEWLGGFRRVEAPLIKNILSSGERLVKVSDDGKPATTIFRPLQKFKEMTLIEARPLTGRTHQIRVHLQHIGHPIAADQKYGDTDFNQQVRKLGLKRLFLHAYSMSYSEDQPSDKVFGLCVSLAPELKKLLESLN